MNLDIHCVVSSLEKLLSKTHFILWKIFTILIYSKKDTIIFEMIQQSLYFFWYVIRISFFYVRSQIHSLIYYGRHPLGAWWTESNIAFFFKYLIFELFYFDNIFVPSFCEVFILKRYKLSFLVSFSIKNTFTFPGKILIYLVNKSFRTISFEILFWLSCWKKYKIYPLYYNQYNL